MVTKDIILADMRDWVSDCVWSDTDTRDIKRMDFTRLVNGISRHYDGGIEGFVAATYGRRYSPDALSIIDSHVRH